MYSSEGKIAANLTLEDDDEHRGYVLSTLWWRPTRIQRPLLQAMRSESNSSGVRNKLRPMQRADPRYRSLL